VKGAVKGILYHMRSVIVTGVPMEALHHTAVIAMGLKQHLADASAFLSFAFTLDRCRIFHIFGSHKNDKFFLKMCKLSDQGTETKDADNQFMSRQR
jgi:hypothetical protein